MFFLLHCVVPIVDSSDQPASVSECNRELDQEHEHELGRRGSMMSRIARLSSAAPAIASSAHDNDDGGACDDVHDATGYVSMHDGDAE
jgi:hypothetical protein